MQIEAEAEAFPPLGSAEMFHVPPSSSHYRKHYRRRLHSLDGVLGAASVQDIGGGQHHSLMPPPSPRQYKLSSSVTTLAAAVSPAPNPQIITTSNSAVDCPQEQSEANNTSGTTAIAPRRFLGAGESRSSRRCGVGNRFPLYPLVSLAACFVIIAVMTDNDSDRERLDIVVPHGLRHHHSSWRSSETRRQRPPLEVSRQRQQGQLHDQHQEVEFLPGMGMRILPDSSVEEREEVTEKSGQLQKDSRHIPIGRIALPTVLVHESSKFTDGDTSPTGRKKRRPRLAHARGSGVAFDSTQLAKPITRIRGQESSVADSNHHKPRREGTRKFPTFVLSPEETDGSGLEELYSARFGKNSQGAENDASTYAGGKSWLRIFLAVTFPVLFVQVVWAYIKRA